jgi:hypothetical protein
VSAGLAIGAYAFFLLNGNKWWGVATAVVVIFLPVSCWLLPLSRSLWLDRAEWDHPYFLMRVLLLCVLFVGLVTIIGRLVYDQVEEDLGAVSRLPLSFS